MNLIGVIFAKMNTPHLDRLAKKFDDPSEKSFFNQWDRIKSNNKEVDIRFYEMLDQWISAIPEDQLEVFEEKIARTFKKRDLKRYRDWEQLFDVFNESFGFHILKRKYNCTKIEFIEQEGKSPDLIGIADDQRIYLEVKTINHSDKERESWHIENTNLQSWEWPSDTVKEIKGKIKKVYHEAIVQLKAIPHDPGNRYIVAMVINVDHNITAYSRIIFAECQEFLETIEDPKYFIEGVIKTY